MSDATFAARNPGAVHANASAPPRRPSGAGALEGHRSLVSCLSQATSDPDQRPADRRITMHFDDFLSIRDFTPQEILHLIGLGSRVKTSPAAYAAVLKGKTLAMIFEKPSLRTRVSFDVGI